MGPMRRSYVAAPLGAHFTARPEGYTPPLTTPRSSPLRRQLGLPAVAAVVVGNMLGSGIFFTPGELAAVAQAPWQVYFFWALCGAITLCGALTLAELTVLVPHAGASYHIIREGFGPFWAFLKIWIEMWVSGPGSVAGVAILLGELAHRLTGERLALGAVGWGMAGIATFTAVNLLGVRWGGRTQVVLTTLKVLGLVALVGGGLLLAAPATSASASSASGEAAPSLLGFLRFVGLGVAVVLFTYDGWVDVSHVAGEVESPRRSLPLGLGLGVTFVTLLYLVVNYAYLRVVPLEAMRADPSGVAGRVARAAFGEGGGQVVEVLTLVSILGALGGLVMTLPRLYYAAASQYASAPGPRAAAAFFRALSAVSPRGVPVGAAIFSALLSTLALVAFTTFRRIVTFFVVPLQVVNILMVASVFRLRRRTALEPDAYLAPGYPLVPAVYVFVTFLFLLHALFYNPIETLTGTALTATGLPFYLWIREKERA